MPKKSLSSVQIGQSSSIATARTGQSSGSRWIRARASSLMSRKASSGTAATMLRNWFRNANAGSIWATRSNLVSTAGRCSSASSKAMSGAKKSTGSAWLTSVSLTRRPSAARIKMLASMTRRRRCQSGTIDGP